MGSRVCVLFCICYGKLGTNVFSWLFFFRLLDHIAIDGDEGHLGPQLIGDVDLIKADPLAVLHLMGLCCEVFAAGGFQEGDL